MCLPWKRQFNFIIKTMIHNVYNPLELSNIMEQIIFSKDTAETVLGTFELIIKTVEGTFNESWNPNPSITVDQLKALKKVMQKKYYNKKVILQ